MRKIKRVTQTKDYCGTGKCVYLVMYDNFDRAVYEDIECMPDDVKDFLVKSCPVKINIKAVVYM